MARQTSPSETCLEVGRTALKAERVGLEMLEASLDGAFGAAVDAMISAKGRVIVCGMGKSGHIARKIAATLASTGTPAMFVHPAEASHGDLGMLTGDDVTLVLSNSGETPELADIIAHTRQKGITLIGVASRKNSTLLSKSDIAIVLPSAPEADLNGLAPTTSTTMTLALGDAFAVALMHKRNFTADDYRVFHPGGSLGAKLSLVRDLMHSGAAVPVVQSDAPMADVLIEITQKGFGISAVVDDRGALAGVITDGDLRRHMTDLMDRSARDVMSANPKTILPGARAQEALDDMNARKITCLMVCDGDGTAPIGIIHIHDCLRVGLV
jgi:arabinose-5-phosphate isomerase